MRRSTAARRLDAGDPIAAARLGRIKTPRKTAAARLNGTKGGQPPRYRLTSDGVLERRDGDRWVALIPPYDKPAHTALYRLRHQRS